MLGVWCGSVFASRCWCLIVVIIVAGCLLRFFVGLVAGSLFVVGCLLFMVRCSSFAVCCVWYVVCCVLCAGLLLSVGVCCLLFAVCCLLCCCVLCDVRCLLFVVSC